MSNSLHTAAQQGDIETLRALIVQGADVNAGGIQGNTPLMLAALYGHVEAVRMLLEAGARPNDTNEVGHNALLMAAPFGQAEVIEILRSAGARVGMIEAGAIGDVYALRQLLAQGAKVDGINAAQTTALIAAAHNGHVSAVRFLLDSGADVNAPAKFGWTALMKALFEGHQEIAHLLIERGADARPHSSSGTTALHIAVGYYSLARQTRPGNAGDLLFRLQNAKHELHTMIRLLVQHGSDVNAKDNRGATALWQAEQRRDTATCALLRELGAYD